MKFLAGRRHRRYRGVLVLSLLASLSLAVALKVPANFMIQKAEVYKSPEKTNASPIHFSDIIVVELHWTIFNATEDEEIRVRIDPALHIVPPRFLSLKSHGDPQRSIYFASCNINQLVLGCLECTINRKPQVAKYHTLKGITRLETALNPELIGSGTQKQFYFENENNVHRSAWSANISIAKPEDYERLPTPNTEMQRTCSWTTSGDEGRYFVCTILFPLGFQMSWVVVVDSMLSGKATPLKALFIQEDLENLKKQTLTQTLVPDMKFSESFRGRGYEFHMDPLPRRATLNGLKFRYRIDVVYQSHHNAEDARGFGGKTRIIMEGRTFTKNSYLPSFSAWKKIFPKLSECSLNITASNQLPWVSPEQLPVPAYVVMKSFGALPEIFSKPPVKSYNQTNSSLVLSDIGSQRSCLNNSTSSILSLSENRSPGNQLGELSTNSSIIHKKSAYHHDTEVDAVQRLTTLQAHVNSTMLHGTTTNQAKSVTVLRPKPYSSLSTLHTLDISPVTSTVSTQPGQQIIAEYVVGSGFLILNQKLYEHALHNTQETISNNSDPPPAQVLPSVGATDGDLANGSKQHHDHKHDVSTACSMSVAIFSSSSILNEAIFYSQPSSTANVSVFLTHLEEPLLTKFTTSAKSPDNSTWTPVSKTPFSHMTVSSPILAIIPPSSAPNWTQSEERPTFIRKVCSIFTLHPRPLYENLHPAVSSTRSETSVLPMLKGVLAESTDNRASLRNDNQTHNAATKSAGAESSTEFSGANNTSDLVNSSARMSSSAVQFSDKDISSEDRVTTLPFQIFENSERVGKIQYGIKSDVASCTSTMIQSFNVCPTCKFDTNLSVNIEIARNMWNCSISGDCEEIRMLSRIKSTNFEQRPTPGSGKVTEMDKLSITSISQPLRIDNSLTLVKSAHTAVFSSMVQTQSATQCRTTHGNSTERPNHVKGCASTAQPNVTNKLNVASSGVDDKRVALAMTDGVSKSGIIYVDWRPDQYRHLASSRECLTTSISSTANTSVSDLRVGLPGTLRSPKAGTVNLPNQYGRSAFMRDARLRSTAVVHECDRPSLAGARIEYTEPQSDGSELATPKPRPLLGPNPKPSKVQVNIANRAVPSILVGLLPVLFSVFSSDLIFIGNSIKLRI